MTRQTPDEMAAELQGAIPVETDDTYSFVEDGLVIDVWHNKYYLGYLTRNDDNTYTPGRLPAFVGAPKATMSAAADELAGRPYTALERDYGRYRDLDDPPLWEAGTA